MMDRNREARRAAAMANGLQRRRHRTTTSSLRDTPVAEEDGPLELQETARLRDRTVVKRDRDREIRDRDRDRERDRLNRVKRRRGVDKSNRDETSVVGDDSSEESVNDEEDEDDDGPIRYIPPSNPSLPPMTSSSPASNNLTHRKSYPPPSKVYRSSAVAPSWKAPDEIIGFSIPRKARSASTKRSHDCWSSGGGGGGGVVLGGEQIPSSSPVRSTATVTATAATTSASPSPAPMSPSSSNISIKKKIKPNNSKQKPLPKSCPKASPSSNQEDIEIEVAEVLYGLMTQSQAPSTSKHEADLTKSDRSAGDFKSRVSTPPSPASHQNSSSQAPPPLTIVAPKRKRPRPYPDENPAVRNNPISSVVKAESDQASKAEAQSSTVVENGDFAKPHEPKGVSTSEVVVANGVVIPTVEESVCIDEIGRAKVEEASSSPKIESQDQIRVETSSTSISTPPKQNSTLVEKSHREEKFHIDLMAPPPWSRGSPERDGGADYEGGTMVDDKSVVTDREAEAKAIEDEKAVKNSNKDVELNVIIADGEADADAKIKAKAVALECEPHKTQHHHHQHQLNFNSKDRNIDLHLDLEKHDRSTDHKHPPPQQPSKPPKDEANTDNKPGQSSSMPLAMPVAAGWHGGLGPMGYVPPLQGVVSMDGTPMASAPIQPPHFMFSQPRPKRCATHCYIARSISLHQQMMKMQHPFWPAAAAAAAASSAPLFGAKSYNLNMVPPSADLHAAARAGAVNSSQDKSHPFAFFPGQPASNDMSSLTVNVPDPSQKKQFLLPQSLPPGAPNNVLPSPAFFFPFGQQQAAAASARPSTPNSLSTGGSAGAISSSSLTPVGSSSTAAAAGGPAMTFSYPNMAGNETQFMAILGNSPYPFPIPAHVGGATPYRGSQPQAMSFFNGSFYSSQMLHPSQLQQQQQQPVAPAQSLQIQQQNHQNSSISTSSSSSQKHLQSQQLRLQGNAASAAASPNSNLQNFHATKNRPSQPHHDVGNEDSPSTADSRTRPNISAYGQNFAMPYHSPNFALLTPSSSIGGGGGNAAGVSNGNHGDKKQQQQQQQQQSQQPAFPMSFASVKGPTTPGLDISSMAHNPAILQSLPEAARNNYQLMAAAAQAAQAANQKKNNYQDSKTGGGAVVDPSSVDEERRAMASRTSAAPAGQSIAFSRDLAENSISPMPGNNVVDSSARSLNLMSGSARPNRSSGPNTLANSGVSNSQQHQPQQQILFPKQQQFVAATVATARSKTPSTSNGSVYPDHLTQSSVMAAKFTNTMPNFPLVQSSGSPSHSSQWKNSVRPNTSQVSSPPVATSTASTIKNHPQQQGRPQPNHTQISFAAAATNSNKPPTASQGQQTPNSNQVPSSPMIVGSPSNSSVSKSAGGGTRTVTTSAGNKAGPQASTISTQQGKNSPSTSTLSSQKPSILGNPHMMSTNNSTSKPQSQESQQQAHFSKHNIHQTQLYFSTPYMQSSANASAGGGYYLQRHRPENQQQQVSKSQGQGPPTSSSGMLSLCTPVSLANATTSDPAKAVSAAAAANSMKGGQPPQGLFHATQFTAAQSAGGTHQLVPAGFPYVGTAVQVKPAEQKQPAGE